LAEPDKKQNFWTTLPGVLTGIAAILTAVTGLLVILYPHGFAGSKENPTTAIGATTDAMGTTPAATGASSSPSTSSAMPQNKKATVLVTGKDGTQTRVFLTTFKHWYTDEAIELKSGQSIPFDKIRSIDFFTMHEFQRDVKVTLTDGRILDGTTESGLSEDGFKGETDIGPFTISVVNLKQILFER